MKKFEKEVKLVAVVETVNDDTDLSSDEWKPTKDAFQAYLTRETGLARFNMRQLMFVPPSFTGTVKPFSLREIKDCTLHSIYILEQTIARMIQDGEMREETGGYNLA